MCAHGVGDDRCDVSVGQVGGRDVRALAYPMVYSSIFSGIFNVSAFVFARCWLVASVCLRSGWRLFCVAPTANSVSSTAARKLRGSHGASVSSVFGVLHFRISQADGPA